MVEPLNTKAWQSALDALGTVKANHLEPDLRIAVSAYISALPSLPVVDGGETAEKSEALAREYRPTMDKDIVHAWGADAAAALSEAATLITTQQQEIERLTKGRDAFEQSWRNAWCPDACPITGRRFFMWIDGEPTYGGPFDSYTIPVKDAEGEYSCHRYDHDEGGWKDWTEGLSIKVMDESDWLTLEDRASAAESRVLSLEEEVKEAALHVEQLSELLKIIKEHWVDYDHVFSISVHEADTWLSGRQALSEGEQNG